jgi:Tol biopolymer transport system component
MGSRGWIVAVAAAAAFATGQANTAQGHEPYAAAPFRVTTNAYTFGQAPVFMPDGRVVVSDDFDKTYNNQTYIANPDGTHRKCLTCQLPAPNLVPAVRPQGDWILFHSWMGHHITVGAAGYGGIGSELYVMRPDASHVTKLYANPATHDGEGTDDYHAYWSPDGKRLVWAHFNGNIIDGDGQGRWDVRVADFTVDRKGKPSLTNVRVVRPANGHWYETQWWAPDGSGFLYTESYGTAMNTELFFCRLTDKGCHVTRLTDNPGWDEQAIFTPDMKGVIFMSSRDHPGFYNTFSQIAQDLGLTTAYDNFLVLPVFEVGFLQPLAQEATDLYEVDLRTRAVRRLTTDGNVGWITPEITWNPQNNQLWWTENRLPRGLAVPLPLDLANQARQTVQYLQHPTVDPGQLTAGNVTNTLLPVEQRTRVATFAGACAPPASYTFALRRARGARVVHAAAFVDGRSVASRRGRALRRITVPRPSARRTFSIRLVARQSTGRRITWTRSYTAMGCDSAGAR